MMLGSKYPDFDFSEFNADVAAAQAARKKQVADPVADLSLEFSEAPLSDAEPSDVSEDDERYSEDIGRGQSFGAQK